MSKHGDPSTLRLLHASVLRVLHCASSVQTEDVANSGAPCRVLSGEDHPRRPLPAECEVLSYSAPPFYFHDTHYQLQQVNRIDIQANTAAYSIYIFKANEIVAASN